MPKKEGDFDSTTRLKAHPCIHVLPAPSVVPSRTSNFTQILLFEETPATKNGSSLKQLPPKSFTNKDPT